LVNHANLDDWTQPKRNPDGSTNTKLAANSVCCLFPVNTPKGERMVDFAPSDHPHHRGIFLAWHAIEDCFVIDAEYRLKPRFDLTLRHTAFGGFCVKARKDGERKYLDSDGPVALPAPHHLKPKTNWPSRDWYVFEIALESGKTIGIAVVDHPGNPPSLWHNLKPISMINPCIAAPGEYKMRADRTLTLRYRMLVYDGQTPVESIKQLANDYRSDKK
jgi:hypothetical protein